MRQSNEASSEGQTCELQALSALRQDTAQPAPFVVTSFEHHPHVDDTFVDQP